MKTLKSFVLIPLIGAFLCACGAAGGGGTDISVNDVGNVEGTVTDVSTGNPLSGVTVQVGDKSDVTGDSGVYSIQDIDVGTRTVTASITGYQNHNGTCEIGKGTTVSHDIQLTANTSSDTTPPMVSSTSPANNATDIAINSAVTVTFSEAMDVSTITTSTFTLEQGTTPVSGTVTYSGTTATFTPSSNLSYSTSYTASITTGAKDTAGHAMASDYSWSFTTGTASDTGPPIVSSTNPGNNATDIAINSAITATFSETMDSSTVTTTTFTLKQGTTAIAGTVAYNGTTTTFTPSSNLSYSTTYTATITTGVKDAAGNAMASSYSWSFTTEAQPATAPSAPTDVSAIAGDGQIAISWNSVSGATSYNIYWSTTSGATKTNGTKISYAISPYTHAGLTNGTTYYYVVTAIGSGESSESSQVSATPQAGATNPVTSDALYIMDTTVTLNGTFTNPNGYYTTAWFEYGTTTGYGFSTPTSSYATMGGESISNNLAGLLPQTMYHFRLVTQNDGGTFYSSDNTFTTLAALTTPTVLASGSNSADGHPGWLAVDFTSVYWYEENGIKKVGINGGTVTTIASGGSGSASLDSTNVYWGIKNYATIDIQKVGIDGGSVNTLATTAYDNTVYGLGQLAVDATDLYWKETGHNCTIKKVPLSGGSVTILASSGHQCDSQQEGMVVDSTNVYWTEEGNIYKVGKNGGAITTLSSEPDWPRGMLAIDDTSLYWTSDNDTLKMPKTGGTATTILSQRINPFTIDSTSIYWAETVPAGVVIKKVGKDGGEETILASSLNSIGVVRMAVDETNIYLIEAPDRTSWRLTKVPKN